MKEKIANTLRIIIVSFLLSTAIGYSLANWAPPPPCGAPPCGNTPPPINVGPATQMREGNLFLSNWLIAKKAQTLLSTVGTPGCVLGPGCDGPTTLVTKDYVDAQIASTIPGLYQCPVVTNPNVFSTGAMDNGYIDLIVVSSGPLVTTTSGCHGGSVPTSSPKPACNGQTTVDSVCTTSVTTGSYSGGFTTTNCNVACSPV